MKGQKNMEHRHLHVILPDEIHDRIEEYRWQKRIKSKNETVVKLLEYALDKLFKKDENNK